MALMTDDIASAASRLHQAERTRTQIRQLSQDHPSITIDDAYAIQKAWQADYGPYGSVSCYFA